MGAAPSTHLSGANGVFHVKCRSQPLEAHDRAILRVSAEHGVEIFEW